MKEPKSIPVELDLRESCDFAFLKTEGIELTQVLSGDIWTDYNEHDPGVTILEQVCFALTELAYKANIDIADLLLLNTSFDEKALNDLLFFAPKDILPCKPITTNDYRRLLIDTFFPELKNAWVIPSKGEHIGGLYTVYLFLANTDIDKEEVISKAKQLLTAHRNLGEDFQEIIILKPHPVTIQVSIDIAYDAVPEEILATIQYEIEQTITPATQMTSFEEVASKYNLETIFKGPLLKHGYIEEEELIATELKYFNKVFAIDIIGSITTVEGVLSAYNFKFTSGRDTEVQNIRPYHFPILDLARCKFELILNGLTYEPDLDKVTYFHTVLQSTNQFVPTIRDQQLFTTDYKSQITKKEITTYSSIQHSFPKVYGVSAYGLPAYASIEQQAHAKQLKGYLLFFDQIMVNYLAMLANVKTLFSVKSGTLTEEAKQTYFHALPKDIPDFESLVKDTTIETALIGLNKKYDAFLERKNRILNHLLARFGEAPQLVNFSKLEHGVASSVESKLAYLFHLPQLAMNRAKAKNYYEKESVENVTALKRKLYFLLNIKEQYDTSLLAAIKGNASFMTLKSKKSSAKENIRFALKGKNIREQILLHGATIDNYDIDRQQNKFHILFQLPTSSEATSIYSDSSYENCQVNLQKLVEHLKNINQYSEGFHLVEHILLRPVESIAYRFHINEQGIPLLSSFDLYASTSKKVRKVFLDKVLELGDKKANYQVEKNKEGKHFIALKDAEKIIAITSEFNTDNEAKAVIGPIMKWLKNIDSTQFLRKKEGLTSEENIEAWHNASYENFEHKISIVLPNWPARFQNLSFRQLFQQTIIREMPPHLVVDFHWISVDTMIKFESTFLKWQGLKQQVAQEGLDAHSFKLLSILNDLASDKQ